MSPTFSDLPPAPPGKTGWPWTDEGGREPGESSYDTPRISVVTPSFQQAAFLEETLRSVLLQGYPALEYIVIDGGSTDGSVEIIERYAPWISYWLSESDDGQSDALRKGFDRAGGKVLAWLNSDDRLRPGALAAAAAAFARNPEAGLVYARSAICDGEGRLTGAMAGTSFSLERTIAGDNCVAQPSAFFTRAAYEGVGGLDRSLHYVMDMDLWLRIALRWQVVYEDAVWSDFRHHAASKTGQGALNFDREILRIIGRALQDQELPDALRRQRRSMLARMTLRLGYRHYEAGDPRSRSLALRALRMRPTLAFESGAGARLARCLAGARPVRRLKAWAGWDA